MDSETYIKSLEERIEKQQKIITHYSEMSYFNRIEVHYIEVDYYKKLHNTICSEFLVHSIIHDTLTTCKHTILRTVKNHLENDTSIDKICLTCFKQNRRWVGPLKRDTTEDHMYPPIELNYKEIWSIKICKDVADQWKVYNMQILGKEKIIKNNIWTYDYLNTTFSNPRDCITKVARRIK